MTIDTIKLLIAYNNSKTSLFWPKIGSLFI